MKAKVGGRSGWYVVRDGTGERAEEGSGWRVRVLDDVALLTFWPPEDSCEQPHGVQVPLDLLQKLNGGPPAALDPDQDYEAPPSPFLVVQPSAEPAAARFPSLGFVLAILFWAVVIAVLGAMGVRWP